MTVATPTPSNPARDHEFTPAAQADMVAALYKALQAQHGGAAVELIETHISFVLVAGAFAYKLRKAVDPGFLDFTTRARRHHDCLEELRLNRRLAPHLYLDVQPVTGTAGAPQIGGPGAPIDWALRMRAFDQTGLWDRLIRRGELRGVHIDALAGRLCTFHAQAAPAAANSRFGRPVQVREPVRDNLLTLDDLLPGAADRARLHTLGLWEADSFNTLRPVIARRRLEGRVRECHGDLHLGNVARIEGRTTVFDCIEFSEDLRWIDVMSDIAFMAMDLQFHGRPDLAHRFVNACLAHSGDYPGVRVLRYQQVCRALVRAKVAALRAAQLAPDEGAAQAAIAQAVRPYLELALRCTRPAPAALMITHGHSGSGKTTLTQSLIEAAGAIRIRADVERKRLFGLDALARSESPPDAGLYGDDATAATYTRLRQLAAEVLASGFSVVLDATFLRRPQREQARQLARDLGVGWAILDFDAEPEVLRERIRQRREHGHDASEADLQVLASQLRNAEPLTDDERAATHRCGPASTGEDGELRADWSALLQTLASPTGTQPI